MNHSHHPNQLHERSLWSSWLSAFTRLRSRDSVTAALAACFGAVALGHAVQIANGAYHPTAFRWMVLALVVVLTGVIAPLFVSLDVPARRLLPFMLFGGLLFELYDLMRFSPGIYLQLTGPRPLDPYFYRLIILAVLAAAGFFHIPRVNPVRFPLMVGAYIATAAWVIQASPNPLIDVYVAQRDSAEALLQGVNPYELTFPHIYGDERFYGPGMIVDGRLQYGYTYMPLTLLLALPSHLLVHDFRFSQLAAVALTAALIYYARPGRVSAAAAALLLMLPRGFFVLEQGWTDPFVLVLLSASVFTAIRAPRILPYALGLFLASKQYTVVLAPIAMLLSTSFRSRALGALLVNAGIVAAFVTLPLVLWNPGAFFHSAIEQQIRQTFRDDALSILVWYKQLSGTELPVVLGFAGALIGVLLSFACLPRTPAGFAYGIAITFFLFVALNKQSFANYYFLVSGCLLVAVGASDLPDKPRERDGGTLSSA